MIDGIGIDVVDIKRFHESLERTPGLREKLFTESEQSVNESSLAARFAAKEAFSKALGTGLRGPASFQNIAVAHDELGKPLLVLAPELQAFMQSKQIRHTHLTISDERNLAAAFVVLET